MRKERWWWLAGFCVVSLGIHIALYVRSHHFGSPYAFTRPAEIEVSLEPLPEEKPKPRPETKPPAPRPPAATPKAERKPAPNAAPRMRERTVVAKLPGRPNDNRSMESKIPEPRPDAPQPDPGGVDRTREEKPLPLGQSAARNIPRPREPILPGEPTPTEARTPEAPAAPDPSRAAGALSVTPRFPQPRIALENPLAGVRSDDKPVATPRRAAGITRIARANTGLSGGGSPAPSAFPGGRGGAPGPPAPPEDILFSGGGAGGDRLPKIAPRIGGGGGHSLPFVNNPLASAAIPEERPGQGPGLGGGAGAGRGGGVGFGRGRGIGTDPNGRVALGTLRSRSGPGIGAGSGSGIGTRSPGGGRGTGSELPGTGGTGFGYGRGSGVGIGIGFRPGIGGSGIARGGLSGGGGGGSRVALSRGIPFGDITGLLRGGDRRGGGGTGGGPGGRGRGAGAGGRTGGADAPVAVVYLLDISSSMREGNKIGQAKTALKKALSELKRKDSFNIVTFYGQVEALASSMLSATPANIQEATAYVDSLRTSYRTNISGAFERAFVMKGRITEMFLLSDGEPSVGIEDFNELRKMVRERNQQKVRISALALGLGEQFRGIPLLKGIAEDNRGQFAYVNLAK